MGCRTVCLLVLCLALWATPAWTQRSLPEKEAAAVAAAEEWVSLLDSGKYEQSWREAAGYLRDLVKEPRRTQAVRAVRNSLGGVISRTLKDTSFKTSLLGVPDGRYVVIQFDASFENKKSAIETVTPMLDKDGKWRVAGYYVE